MILYMYICGVHMRMYVANIYIIKIYTYSYSCYIYIYIYIQYIRLCPFVLRPTWHQTLRMGNESYWAHKAPTTFRSRAIFFVEILPRPFWHGNLWQQCNMFAVCKGTNNPFHHLVAFLKKSSICVPHTNVDIIKGFWLSVLSYYFSVRLQGFTLGF